MRRVLALDLWIPLPFLSECLEQLGGRRSIDDDRSNALTLVEDEPGTVVRRLAQCLTEMTEIGGQLMRNPQAVAEERIRRAAAQMRRAQAAAAVLKATTDPAGRKAV